MRSLRIFTHLLLIGTAMTAAAQECTNVIITSAPCTSFAAQVSVFFPFGAGSTCPDLVATVVTTGDATALVDLYYDASGPWPQLGCSTTDVVNADLDPGIVMVNLRTFSIWDNDTSAVVSDTLLNVCSTGIPDVHPDLMNWRSTDDRLTWTRPKDPATGLIEIINSGGQLIRTCGAQAGTCWLGDMSPGVYLARWPSGGSMAAFRFALH